MTAPAMIHRGASDESVVDGNVDRSTRFGGGEIEDEIFARQLDAGARHAELKHHRAKRGQHECLGPVEAHLRGEEREQRRQGLRSQRAVTESRKEQ